MSGRGPILHSRTVPRVLLRRNIGEHGGSGRFRGPFRLSRAPTSAYQQSYGYDVPVVIAEGHNRFEFNCRARVVLNTITIIIILLGELSDFNTNTTMSKYQINV